MSCSNDEDEGIDPLQTLLNCVQDYNLELYKFKPFEWRLLEPLDKNNHPNPQILHRLVFHDHCLYSYYDGCSIGREVPSEFWEYDVYKKRWRNVTKMVTGESPWLSNGISALCLKDPTGLSQDTKLLVLGGHSEPYEDPKSIRLFDLKTFHCEILPAANADQQPIETMGQSTTFVDDVELGPILYVVGGKGLGIDIRLDVHRFSLNDFTWTRCYKSTTGSPGQGRYNHGLAYYDSKMYLLGGLRFLTAAEFDKIWCFDTKLKGQRGYGDWTQVMTLPDSTIHVDLFPGPRYFNEFVQYGKYAYIFGGCYYGPRICTDFWQLDLESLEWRLISNSSSPSYMSSSAVTPAGQVFRFGGNWDEKIGDKVKTNRLQSLWLEIPSLKEMAWEAITHYMPKIAQVEPGILLSCGIPQDIVNCLRQ